MSTLRLAVGGAQHSSAQRLVYGLPITTLITISLFLLMRYLILPDTSTLQEIEEPEPPVIIRKERDEGDRPLPGRELPKRNETELPPPPPPMDPPDPSNPVTGANGVSWALPNVPKTIDGSTPVRDRRALPLVRVSPVYPSSAATKGVEGWVLVEFDIAETGAVINPHIVDAEPKGYFERASLKAIGKWKYQPKIVDGKPVAQYGMQEQIRYRLED